MRISVVGFKGGVGKTTTAVHLAAYLQERAPTILIDGDPNRSATEWAAKGLLPFRVEDEKRAARTGAARDFAHVVMDTEARPTPAELKDIAEDFELLVIPTTPDMLALKALQRTIGALQSLKGARFKTLLTICPPSPSRDAEHARGLLEGHGLPVFRSDIPRLVAFQKAALAGVPVDGAHDPRASAAWEAYRAVGMEIVR